MDLDQSKDAAEIYVTTLSGKIVDLIPPIVCDERAEEIRPRLAEALSISIGQVVIWCGETELLDGQPVRNFKSAAPNIVLTVQILPCQLRPSEYIDQIDKESTGFVEVAKIQYPRWHPLTFPEGTSHDDRYCYADKIGIPGPLDERVVFPEPRGININMMPFVLGDIQSLPEAYQHYWPLIEHCSIPSREMQHVCYLTIQEGVVPAGESQRRSGVHIESPGALKMGGEHNISRYNWGCGTIIRDESEVEGGIYMASTVPKSCRIWNMRIREPAKAVDQYGGLEHMRDILGEGEFMEPCKMYWLTDATPHESVPLEQETYRQFFRVVTSELSMWYREHSTANDKVTIDEAKTSIVLGSKFD